MSKIRPIDNTDHEAARNANACRRLADVGISAFAAKTIIAALDARPYRSDDGPRATRWVKSGETRMRVAVERAMVLPIAKALGMLDLYSESGALFYTRELLCRAAREVEVSDGNR